VSDTTSVTEAQPDNLIDWLKAQRNTVANLQRLREFAVQLEMDADEIALIDEMLDRIERHRFTIAVVGEFKRGKSTFVNALLGEEILPSDVLPATATLNRVTYDLRKYVQIQYKPDESGAARSEEIPIDRLPEYVTKLTTESQQRAATIAQAIVHHDNMYLSRNVDMIDTPGLNDNEAMTAITMSVLPFADAAIMVLNPENPFGGYEGEFLNKLLLSDLGRVIFVVNAIDRVEPEDRGRLIAEIRRRIHTAVVRKAEERFGAGADTEDERQLHIKRIGEPQVFGLSSADALEAKHIRDSELEQSSLFPEFERALERFLAHERGVVTLQGLTARVIVSGTKIQQRIHQEISTAQMSREELEQVYSAAAETLAQLEQQFQHELRQIDTAIEKTRQLVRPIVAQMGEDVKRATTKAIDEAKIAPADVSKANQKATLDRLGREVTNAAEIAGRAIAERVQFVIQKEVELELERVSEFASAVDRSLHTIDLRFSRSLAQSADQITTKQLAVAGVAGATIFVGGGTAMWVSAVLAGMTIISIPVALLVLLPLGLAALLGGRKLASVVFSQDRADNFRKAYRDAALLQVDQQIQAQYSALERQFDDHVVATFTAIKREIEREIGGAIEQQRRTLDDLRGRRERNQAMNELQIKEFERISSETQRIIGKAHGLSNQLRDIKEV